MCCSQLCSHCGWLLLKCSAIGIGFNGAETNCRIAHILGILLMNSCNTDRFLATTVVYGLSTLNWSTHHYQCDVTSYIYVFSKWRAIFLFVILAKDDNFPEIWKVVLPCSNDKAFEK